MILAPLLKLPKNVVDLGKFIVAKGFKKLPKVQKIANSGHTGAEAQLRYLDVFNTPPFGRFADPFSESEKSSKRFSCKKVTIRLTSITYNIVSLLGH